MKVRIPTHLKYVAIIKLSDIVTHITVSDGLRDTALDITGGDWRTVNTVIREVIQNDK